MMLKDFGVKGVKVQEVLSLDDEMLAMLPYVRIRIQPRPPRLIDPDNQSTA